MPLLKSQLSYEITHGRNKYFQISKVISKSLVDGEVSKGWDGNPFWISKLEMSDEQIFYFRRGEIWEI
jgi:hypothetical protein